MIIINTIAINGRLTRDPDVRYSQNEGGTTVAQFGLAVNRRFKDKDGKYVADFFDVTVFGKNAEWCEKYMSKGMKIDIVGHLQQDRWTDKDGNNRSRVIIIGDQVDFGESKAASQQSQGQNQTQATPQQQQSQPTTAQSTDGFMNIPDGIDESLPFM